LCIFRTTLIIDASFVEVPRQRNHRDENNLRKKAAVFQYESKTRKTIHLVLITTIELVKNNHSGIIQNTILLDDLFQ
jgi:hypothetical protein